MGVLLIDLIVGICGAVNRVYFHPHGIAAVEVTDIEGYFVNQYLIRRKWCLPRVFQRDAVALAVLDQ